MSSKNGFFYGNSDNRIKLQIHNAIKTSSVNQRLYPAYLCSARGITANENACVHTLSADDRRSQEAEPSDLLLLVFLDLNKRASSWPFGFILARAAVP